MRIILLSLLWISSFAVFSQSVELQVIGSTGEIISNSNNSLAFTLGEVVSETIETSENQLTQGFHQGLIKFVFVERVTEVDFETRIFPNPANSFTNLEIANIDFNGFSYSLYDLTGKQIQSAKFQSQQERINLDGLSQSMYILKIENQQLNISETYQLQKI